MDSAHEISEEYIILRFLNDFRNENGTSRTTFSESLPLTEEQIDSTLLIFKSKDYTIDKPNGVSIGRQGEIRLNQMQKIIDFEKNQKIQKQDDEIISLQKQLIKAQITDHKWKRWDIYLGALIGLASSLILIFAQSKFQKKEETKSGTTEIIEVNVSTHQAAIDTMSVLIDTKASPDSATK